MRCFWQKITCFTSICVLLTVLQSGAAYAEEKKITKKDYIDNLVEEIPYGEEIRATWKFMDGDVDVMGVENLRVDISNAGLKYKTDSLPFIGEMNGGEFTAELGEDSRLTYESEHVPFIGRIEGMKFHSSVGDDARVSIRYTIAFP